MTPLALMMVMNFSLKKHELKAEHQGTVTTFLELDVTMNDNIFICKVFDKKR